MGNIHSVTKSLESLGEEVILISDFNESKACKAIILPGVGAFDPAMNNLINTELINDLKNWIKSGKSFFGICLGLQLLFESSDEGKVQGLGILKGKINNQWKELMNFQLTRARYWFQQSEDGIKWLSSDARWPVWTSLRLYRGILDSIERLDYDVFNNRAFVKNSVKAFEIPISFLISRIK